jgi:AcrR family transcriptional regulator
VRKPRNPADGRVLRAERLRRERREEVLAGARREFSRRGYHRTGVAHIIAAAGVARGTFYVYFRNKRAIFEELVDGLLGLLRAAVRRVEVGPGAPPPVEQLRGNVERVLATIIENRELTRILLHAAVGLDAQFDRKLAEFYGRVLQMIEGALVLGREMGLVRPCDERVVARCVLGSIKEVIHGMLVAAEGRDLAPPAVAREILGYNVRGLVLEAPGAHDEFVR